MTDHAKALRDMADHGDGAYDSVTLDHAADWVEQALEVLRAVEWTGVSWEEPVCPVCSAEKLLDDPHAPDCKLAALIGTKVAE
jgi:hypothetical protein